MGILGGPIAFMKALKLARGFTVCELGDQYVTEGPKPHYLAEKLYVKWGAERYVSIDGNGNGTILWDLNLPLDIDLGEFDLVTDFGTGEHIFDQAQVWRTVHKLTKVGGYIAFDRPTGGYPGHCFYLIDPSLIRDLAAANGYEIVAMGESDTSRGHLIRGVFRKTSKAQFVNPQQGRYEKALRPILDKEHLLNSSPKVL